MTFFGCPEPSHMSVYYSHLQVLNSGNIDVAYLGKILDFALITLQKLSAPAKVDELKIAHQKFLGDLSEICEATDASNKSNITVLVKGLQFVMEQMQVGFSFYTFFLQNHLTGDISFTAPLIYWESYF